MQREHRSLKTNERIISHLVEKCQKGDTEAFAKLYDIFFDPLYRYLFYRSNGNGVEDLLETIFLKLWLNMSKYKPQESPFSAWVFRIAHNVLIDSYREHKKQAVDEIPENHAEPRREYATSHLLKKKLEKEALKEALKKLKPSYQQIIVLKFINELTNEEVSKILEKSENSLRILQFRALRALKKELITLGITEYDE